MCCLPSSIEHSETFQLASLFEYHPVRVEPLAIKHQGLLRGNDWKFGPFVFGLALETHLLCQVSQL